jgi:hypothetical protein
MARIFSIDFIHEGNLCHAMVTVRSTPFFTEYSVQISDEDVAAQLPNNKIVSSLKDSYVFSDSTSRNSAALMDELIHAIAGHIRTLQA